MSGKEDIKHTEDHETATSSKNPDASRHIGPYKLLQQIGEGGMGSVWMAEQQKPVHRRVALKVIKAGADTKQVVARFEAERQALAMMDHHNIAKVLDAGTTDSGQPYFVMELVQGIPFDKYCDKNKLSINERLQLFVPVCKAVQHAHQKGIIHRDLKPSNVLVCLYDGKPVPKVIDFGLAKALQHQTALTGKTIFTEFGQVVGTLQYMSPEQAEMNQLDIDTRTDIYSLGVMLYELLTGSTPVDAASLQNQAILKVLESIRETDPPRPSVRLSSSSVEAVTGISEHRRIEPGKLKNILRGELDWIVMKALDKDRTRRYETANGLAEDVEHFLNNEIVNARPPSTGYRIRKYVRKHRVLVGFMLTTMLLLSAGIVGTGYGMIQALRESRQRMVAEVALAEATEALAKAQKAREESERLLLEIQAEREKATEAKIAEEQAAKIADASRAEAIMALEKLEIVKAEAMQATEQAMIAKAETLLAQKLAQETSLAMVEPSRAIPDRALPANVEDIGKHEPETRIEIQVPPQQLEELKRIAQLSLNLVSESDGPSGLDRAAQVFGSEFGKGSPQANVISEVLANAFLDDGQTDKAIPLFESVIERKTPEGLSIDVSFIESTQRLYFAYRSKERFEDADKLTAVFDFKKDASGLNNWCWQKALHPLSDPLADVLEFRERIMRRVCEAEENWANLNTLGLTHYRAGHFELAIAACIRSGELESEKPETAPYPGNFAVLAMSHFRLGNQEEANRYRLQFAEAMKNEAFANDEECKIFEKELLDLFSTDSTTDK